MASDEDDDYMNMTFGEEPKATETSLQRRQRLKREGEIKGRVKSKAELAAEEREAREAALSKSMLEGPQAKKSKGLAMMAKMGFKGGALGSRENADARVEPIRPEMRDDRGGIGLDSERKRKLRDAAEGAEKKVKVDELAFRDRVRRERETARCERQVYAAMKVCERMDEERQAGPPTNTTTTATAAAAAEGTGEPDGATPAKKRTLSTRPLKSIPVVWRGLVRGREESERDRRMKYDLQQTSTTRLPTYEDDLEDEDDKTAAGKTETAHALVEDLDEEDSELDEFNTLEAEEKLRRLVEHLRKGYSYCFWCKFEYPDDTMEGCPGSFEEDHD
ncbi:putative g-patch domain-containing protein [Rosellinia necatrix]|uniref:Putative g-patch domain-containing protein n=1 Tax=Rosellinia necatrix TaxID=77044 RepID=A0A1W2TDY3_ROSNE|nr:putative g-patch domain-containing protein [Rosellinia necatrix]